jgi:gamma-glutamylcyclotransferase (GGCT)/AIG2-like uncharacterized protein YtfP
MPEMALCFAYGSNMDYEQMRKRCPSARFICIAKLPDHRLAFTRKSVKRNCGVADAVPESGCEVWGVVYEITDEDLERLDRCEGFSPGRARNSYIREKRYVLADGDPNRPIEVHIYFAVREENPPLPNEEYKRQLVKGAQFWSLPAGYIAELERIKTAP